MVKHIDLTTMKKVNETISVSDEICHYCFKEGKTLRCSKCKITRYCSKLCQKRHWKVHKVSCLGNTAKAKAKASDEGSQHYKPSATCKNVNSAKDIKGAAHASFELENMIGKMSMQDMIESYHRANDEVERLKAFQSSLHTQVPDKEFIDNIHVEQNEIMKGEIETNSPRTSTENRIFLHETFDNQDDDLKEVNESQSQSHQERFAKMSQPNSLFCDTFCPSPIDNTKAIDYGDWNYTVEKLIYVSSFSISIMPDTTSASETNGKSPAMDPLSIRSEDIEIEISDVTNTGQPSTIREYQVQRKKTALQFQLSSTNGEGSSIHVLARMILPFEILGNASELMSSLHFDGTFISLRVQYHDPQKTNMDNIMPDETMPMLTPTNALTNLQCRSCHYPLLKSENPSSNTNNVGGAKKNNSIRNVCHLPTGFWDEITDYLTCYDGQPSIDFSTVGNIPGKGTMFEDETILVANQHDLNTCVLAIDGYGEHEQKPAGDTATKVHTSDSSDEKYITQNVVNAEYRGSRDWHDTVGGATLTCLVCCSTLGYASISEPDGCRLLKHRLRACSTADGNMKDHLKHNTCASFIGKELIRYAESQAVFTFAIFGYRSNGSLDQCLLLRVLSWNTSIAMKGDNGVLDFRRAVKIIFQDVDATLLLSADAEKNSNNPMDPMQFSWGGVDLCCPPTSNGAQSHRNMEQYQDGTNVGRASVNLFLSIDEWQELRDNFVANSKLFPEAISQATVTLKLGGGDSNVGRTAFLSFASL